MVNFYFLIFIFDKECPFLRQEDRFLRPIFDKEDRLLIGKTETQFLQIIKKLPKSLPAGFQSTVRAVPSRIQTLKVNVALYQRFEKVWHFQMSLCHNFELCDICRFLSHGMCFV